MESKRRGRFENLKPWKPYLEEMTFRFNRKNAFLFRDTIKRLIASPNLEYKKLMQAP